MTDSDFQAAAIPAPSPHRDDLTPSHGVIPPGSTIGMVGGGQLGRMFAIAAAQLGYRVGVFCGSSDEPASQVAAYTVCGPLDDHSAIESFARGCDVITLEFENIPAETIAVCSRFAPTFPDASVLAIAQDRLLEKTTLRDAGLAVTPFAAVHDAASAKHAGEKLGWPMIVKTCRSGYDGKGQHRLNQAADVDQVDWVGGGQWIAEALVPFDLEISVIVARTSDGRLATYPVFENAHVRHVLDVTYLPAAITTRLSQTARQMAVDAAENLNLVGLLCVEMFVAGDQIVINEIAPRPHNSGHVTIEACSTSQFQQHVRAICGLPLGQTDSLHGAAAMANLLGDLWPHDGKSSPPWDKALAAPGVSLHLYGKHAPRPGRKMGHLVAVGRDRAEVSMRLTMARDSLA